MVLQKNLGTYQNWTQTMSEHKSENKDLVRLKHNVVGTGIGTVVGSMLGKYFGSTYPKSIPKFVEKNTKYLNYKLDNLKTKTDSAKFKSLKSEIRSLLQSDHQLAKHKPAILGALTGALLGGVAGNRVSDVVSEVDGHSTAADYAISTIPAIATGGLTTQALLSPEHKLLLNYSTAPMSGIVKFKNLIKPGVVLPIAAGASTAYLTEKLIKNYLNKLKGRVND